MFNAETCRLSAKAIPDTALANIVHGRQQRPVAILVAGIARMEQEAAGDTLQAWVTATSVRRNPGTSACSGLIVAGQVLWSIVCVMPGLGGLGAHIHEPAVVWWLIETDSGVGGVDCARC